MRRFTVRILIALLTFTAGIVVSKLFMSAGSESRSFSALARFERNGSWGCKKRRGLSRVVETPGRSARFVPLPDKSLLDSTYMGYSEVMGFAEFLQNTGIAVESIHRSKLEGLFRHTNKAAFIRTDKGVVEVVFDPNGAEKIQISQSRDGRSYRYSLRADNETQTIDSRWPFYFVRHQNWFIVTRSESLASEIRLALTPI